MAYFDNAATTYPKPDDVYHKNLKLEEDDEKEIEEFEIKVFSRVPLNRMMGEKLFVTFSQHDFSVCYPVMKEGR